MSGEQMDELMVNQTDLWKVFWSVRKLDCGLG